eukprot:7476140-Pyramimonas_sp.AAC.1
MANAQLPDQDIEGQWTPGTASGSGGQGPDGTQGGPDSTMTTTTTEEHTTTTPTVMRTTWW